jgi:ribosome-associated toxin RatA of RatAB toxin-antitoxin module
MVFILFEDGSNINIMKMMVGSMIRGDFTENLKKHWNVSKWAQEICKLNIFINQNWTENMTSLTIYMEKP